MDELEDEEECNILLNFDEFENNNSLESDDESFYSGDHIGGLGFMESKDNDWSTVSSMSTWASCNESRILLVSTRYHDDIYVHKHGIGDDKPVDIMRYAELIGPMDVRASKEENTTVIWIMLEVGYTNEEELRSGFLALDPGQNVWE